ncbi:MAG: DUF6259 domain-containing protein [Verrucomicrobiae bacterium]|nr:DUF6259 domain-containing protein [Verrucomicrobiae bacterium]
MKIFPTTQIIGANIRTFLSSLLLFAGLVDGLSAADAGQSPLKMPLVNPLRLFLDEKSDWVELGNGRTNFRFSRNGAAHHGQRLSLDAIWDGTDGVNYVSPKRKEESLWRLAFLEDDGRGRLDIDSHFAKRVDWRCAQTDDAVEARFEWSEFAAPKAAWLRKVILTVRIRAQDAGSEWRLGFDIEGKRVLRSADFPILPNLSVPAEGAFYFPNGWGKEYRNPVATANYCADYPSEFCNMQCSLLHGLGGGLYVGLHDPSGSHKRLAVNPGGSVTIFKTTHYLAETPVPSGAVTDYPCVVACYRGSWISGAKIYRRWALGGGSWAPSPLSKNTAIPQWIKEMDVWCVDGTTDGQASRVVPRVQRFREALQAPCAFHWYCWHRNPFDTQYPDFFPAKDGFMEGIRSLQKSGVRVIPYINGRCYDKQRSASWREEGPDCCAQKLDGDLYSEFGLTVMCPSTALFRQRIASLAERLLNECGTDGVYLDQVGSSPAVGCYNPKHGHPLGGGHWWTPSLREYVAEVRKKLDGKTILCTEGASEICAGCIDACLMCNSTADRLVPLYSAVYGGFRITFGRYFTPSDFTNIEAFVSKLSQMFHFGAQLGWLDPKVVEFEKPMTYLRGLAAFRKRLHAYLVCGELLDEPLDCPGVPSHQVKWQLVPWEPKIATVDVPGVMRSTWRAEDGSIAILLTNLRGTPQRVRFSYDAEKKLGHKPCMATILSFDGNSASHSLDQSVWEFDDDLPPYDVRAILLK